MRPEGPFWTSGPANPSDVRCTCQLGDVARQPSGDASGWRVALAGEAVRQGVSRQYFPGASIGPDASPVNDSPWVVMACPWKADPDVCGLLEIWLPADASDESRRAGLRFLEAIAELVGDDARNRILLESHNRERWWSQWNRFTQQIHGSLVLRQVAYRIANEGRLTVECDRLAVAVSGVDTVDRRATAVRLLEQLTAAVLKTGETFYYEGSAESLPGQLEVPLQHYLDESGCRRLAIVPLSSATAGEPKPGKPFPAALIAEWFHAAPAHVRNSWRQQLALVGEHSAIALANAETLRNIPLSGWLQCVARARWWLQWRQLPWTVLVTAVLAAIVCAGTFLTAEFTVEAEFKMQPARQ